MEAQLQSLKFDEHGLIPAIIQDKDSGQVLMMAWMNAQSVRLTVETGKTHFYSRSRKKLWLKGESSGHIQTVAWIRTDCDRDCLLIGVHQEGAACHDGYYSCFYRKLDRDHPDWEIEGNKVFDPEKVYKN